MTHLSSSIGTYHHIEPVNSELVTFFIVRNAIQSQRQKFVPCSSPHKHTNTHLGPGLNSTSAYVKKFLSLTLLIEPCLYTPMSFKRSSSDNSSASIMVKNNNNDVVVFALLCFWRVCFLQSCRRRLAGGSAPFK